MGVLANIIDNEVQVFLDDIGDDIKLNTPKVTGKTADSVKVNVRSGGRGGAVVGSGSILALYYGRKPASKGNGDLKAAIFEWLKHKSGIKFEPSLTIAGSISYFINKNGTRRYQGLSANPYENIDLESKLSIMNRNIANKYGSKILNDMKKFSKPESGFKVKRIS